MKQNKISQFALLFLGAACLLGSCFDPEPSPDPTTPEVSNLDPPPIGMQKLSVSIEGRYNMEGSKVMSLFDSTLVADNKFVLLVPSGFTSQIFLSDDGGNKIFAVMDTHPGDTVAILNAKNVSVSLLDLLPAYTALDSSEAIQVVKDNIIHSTAFSELQMAVDVAMLNKTDLWDIEASKIMEPLKVISQSLINKYFTQADEKGNRIGATTEIDKWLMGRPGGNAEVGNPVYSYAQVNFQAITSNSSSMLHEFILEPRDLEDDGNFSAPTKRRTDISRLPDDAYKVTISQKSDTVRKKNAEQLGLSILSFLIGKILDHKYAANSSSEGSTLKNCLRDTSIEILKAVENNTYNLVIHGKFESVEAVVEAAKSSIYDSYLGVVNTKSCVKLSTSFGSKTFIKLIGKRMVTALNVYENIKTYAEFRHAAISFIDPEELTGEMQLHFGRLLTGTVQMKKAKELEEIYPFEEIIYPLVKLAVISSFSDIKTEGLHVQWKLEEGNGSSNLLETKFDEDRETNVGWKLPKIPPSLNGEVEITAEILDKEKDHIKGSPVKFKVKLGDPWVKELVGRWVLKEYVKLSDDHYEQHAKMYNDNIDNNPCGMGFTLIGNDPVLGNNTILLNEPVITEEVEFMEDYTAILYQEAFDMYLSSTACTKRPNGSVNMNWEVSSSGYIISRYSGGTLRIIEGQLMKIDDNTYHANFTSRKYGESSNPGYFLLKKM